MNRSTHEIPDTSCDREALFTHTLFRRCAAAAFRVEPDIGELAFVPFDRAGGELLNLITDRYERSATVTINLSAKSADPPGSPRLPVKSSRPSRISPTSP